MGEFDGGMSNELNTLTSNIQYRTYNNNNFYIFSNCGFKTPNPTY